jgi:D-alanyl-D-alanine carboxypeptidase
MTTSLLKRRRRGLPAVAFCLAVAAILPGSASAGADQADARLERALDRIVATPDGPPGVSAVVQRGKALRLHTAGRADLAAPGAIRLRQQMRIASVSKAFTGAVMLRLVEKGALELGSTLGRLRSDLPASWGPITLRQLLYHTSGLPNYTASPAFGAYFGANLKNYISPLFAISFVFGDPLEFAPGARFEYSNTDNIVMALMAESATGRGFAALLRDLVLKPLRLRDTSLPKGFTLPRPFIRGYVFNAPGAPLEEVSKEIGVSSVWAAGGIVSSPRDLNTFIRAWGGGGLLNSRKARKAQTRFLPPFTGGEPPGPGQNRGGLTLYRYSTPCGVAFGHTGNFPGYTQFIAASPDGRRSAVVSANLQLDVATGPPGVFTELRRIFRRAACAALAG